MCGSAHEAFQARRGDHAVEDEEIAKQQANRFQNHHFNKILFATSVAKSTTICRRHISYCEAVYHSSFIISFSRKSPAHSAAFLLNQEGTKEKLQKKMPCPQGLCPAHPRQLLKKLDQNFKTKWEIWLKSLPQRGRGTACGG